MGLESCHHRHGSVSITSQPGKWRSIFQQFILAPFGSPFSPKSLKIDTCGKLSVRIFRLASFPDCLHDGNSMSSRTIDRNRIKIIDRYPAITCCDKMFAHSHGTAVGTDRPHPEKSVNQLKRSAFTTRIIPPKKPDIIEPFCHHKIPIGRHLHEVLAHWERTSISDWLNHSIVIGRQRLPLLTSVRVEFCQPFFQVSLPVVRLIPRKMETSVLSPSSRWRSTFSLDIQTNSISCRSLAPRQTHHRTDKSIKA